MVPRAEDAADLRVSNPCEFRIRQGIGVAAHAELAHPRALGAHDRDHRRDHLLSDARRVVGGELLFLEIVVIGRSSRSGQLS